MGYTGARAVVKKAVSGLLCGLPGWRSTWNREQSHPPACRNHSGGQEPRIAQKRALVKEELTAKTPRWNPAVQGRPRRHFTRQARAPRKTARKSCPLRSDTWAKSGVQKQSTGLRGSPIKKSGTGFDVCPGCKYGLGIPFKVPGGLLSVNSRVPYHFFRITLLHNCNVSPYCSVHGYELLAQSTVLVSCPPKNDK